MADDEALSTNELIAVICEAMGQKVHIWYLNKKIMEMVASAGGCLHLPLNKERLAKLTENYVSFQSEDKVGFEGGQDAGQS